jgi:N-methylhydantoinase B
MSVDSDTIVADPIHLEVFSNRIVGIIEEMGARLVRAAFSANIKERRDCSVALFDAQGRLVAQAAHIPMHLGSLLGGVEATIAAYAPDTMRPGDAFVCNDAYLAGGTHLPDISVVTPIFAPGLEHTGPRFFAANLGHHADVGGAVPGSISPDAASIFEEGVRIPPTRLVREGELDEGVLWLIAHNTREPQSRVLDLKGQIATNDVGVAQVCALITRMGASEMEQAVADLLTYTARRLRNKVAELPDGVYAYTTHMDNDGVAGDQVPICAEITVSGDRARFDFAGTGPQSRGGFNVMPSGVMATVAYAIKALLDPELPPNSGLFDAIELVVPEGSILNPNYPAAVGARTTTCQKLAGAIFGALSEVLPEEKVMASSHDVLAAMTLSGPSRHQPSGHGANSGDGAYVYLETIGGGNGARALGDGMDGAHAHITNSLNMPIEAVENEYPLLVEEYALIADSGGAGQYRGGMGIARSIRAIAPGTTFSSRSDSFITAAAGAAGGKDGSHCQVVRNENSIAPEILDPKQRLMAIEVGETIRMETPGGAGYGAPSDRDAADLARDLADGRVSEAAALRDYGEALVATAQKLNS